MPQRNETKQNNNQSENSNGDIPSTANKQTTNKQINKLKNNENHYWQFFNEMVSAIFLRSAATYTPPSRSVRV